MFLYCRIVRKKKIKSMIYLYQHCSCFGAFWFFLKRLYRSQKPLSDVLFLGLWYSVKECSCTKQFTGNELKCQSSQLFCQKTPHNHCMELPGSCGKLSESPSWDIEGHGEPAWSPINKTHWAHSAHYLVIPNKELSQREATGRCMAH